MERSGLEAKFRTNRKKYHRKYKWLICKQFWPQKSWEEKKRRKKGKKIEKKKMKKKSRNEKKNPTSALGQKFLLFLFDCRKCFVLVEEKKSKEKKPDPRKMLMPSKLNRNTSLYIIIITVNKWEHCCLDLKQALKFDNVRLFHESVSVCLSVSLAYRNTIFGWREIHLHTHSPTNIYLNFFR